MPCLRPLLMLGASAFLSVSWSRAQTPLAARIGHTDPSKYTRSRSLNSAGDTARELLVSSVRDGREPQFHAPLRDYARRWRGVLLP